MEKKIKFLKGFYLFFSSSVFVLYFIYSFFPKNFKDSIKKVKSFQYLFKIDRKTVILNEKGSWIYLVGSGFYSGKFGYIISDEFFIEGKRGFNIIVIGDKDIKTGSFDTHKYKKESERMEDFLSNLPDSCVVIMYIEDEGTASLTSSLQNLLKSFGSKISLKNKYRWGYVFIFEKRGEKFKNIFEDASPSKIFVLKIKLKMPNLNV